MPRPLILLRRALIVALIVFSTGLVLRQLGPPHPVGYTCWYEPDGPHCSAQPPGWMYADQT